MNRIYFKLIDSSLNGWLEKTIQNFLIHLFQKHKQKLDIAQVVDYLQKDLGIIINNRITLDTALLGINLDYQNYSFSEQVISKKESLEKWNENILREIRDSFEREVTSNLQIDNHRQFWKDYQLHVFIPIVKKAFYKYAIRNSLKPNLEIYDKSISEEFKKIIIRYTSIDSISSFIKKFTSKEKISISYFLLYIKYYYTIEFLKGNLNLEDQADIQNYLQDYLDIQIVYFFEALNTATKLESYFTKSTETLSSILIDDSLKKNFDNEKRLRDTLDALIKDHRSNIEEYYISNTEKINEVIKTTLDEKKNIINLSEEISQKQLEFQKEIQSDFKSMFMKAKDNIDEYLKIHNQKLDELLKNNSQQQQQMQSVNNEINDKQRDLNIKVAEIAAYEKRIEGNLQKQVVIFSKRDLANKQKAYNNAEKSYKSKRTKFKKQKGINKKRPLLFTITGFLSLISLGFSIYLFLKSEPDQIVTYIVSGLSSLSFIYFIVVLSQYISVKEILNEDKEFLVEDSKELREKRNDLRELARNFNRDTNNTINNITIEQINGAQFGDNNDMNNTNTQNFRDTQPPFKVTDFSKG